VTVRPPTPVRPIAIEGLRPPDRLDNDVEAAVPLRGTHGPTHHAPGLDRAGRSWHQARGGHCQRRPAEQHRLSSHEVFESGEDQRRREAAAGESGEKPASAKQRGRAVSRVRQHCRDARQGNRTAGDTAPAPALEIGWWNSVPPPQIRRPLRR